MMSVQSSLVMYPIHAYGSEAQREKYLPPLASGESIGCFGLTEPDHGSDPGSMVTRARSVDGGYRVSGAKMWITNSPIADVFVVWAKTDDGRIRGFILEKGMEGLSAPKIEGKHALRASVTGEIVMDDVFVPEENLLPERRGPEGALRLPEQRALRHRLGRPRRRGGLLARGAPVHAGAQPVRPSPGRQPAHPAQAGRHADGDRPRPAGLPARRPADGRGPDRPGADLPDQAQLLRQGPGRRAQGTRHAGRQRHFRRVPVMRHIMNLEVVNTYEGTHDIHALILGRTQTDIPAF
jgi:glutaryl-CoA dehydrogenase